MKAVSRIIISIAWLIPLLVSAEGKEIPFTLDDRDRIIRTEQKIEALDSKMDTKVDDLRSEMNVKFEGMKSEMNARFDQLFNFLWAIIGIFTTMMVSVFGFAFWDRKLSMRPVKDQQKQMLNVLREYAANQPRLREILKNAGLM
jgi:hypothetical protein